MNTRLAADLDQLGRFEKGAGRGKRGPPRKVDDRPGIVIPHQHPVFPLARLIAAAPSNIAFHAG